MTGLTKKAIEYYEKKGLIAPAVEENGYRNFSEEDVKRLKEISVLRKLGLSIAEIREVLEGKNREAVLAGVKYRRDLQLEEAREKQQLLAQLMEGKDIDWVAQQLEHLDKQQTIKEKLLNAFPGCYGQWLVFHFGSFLNDRILTDEQEQAYNAIIDFLDNVVNIEIPSELEKFFEDMMRYMDAGMMESVAADLVEAIEDVDRYIEQNRDILEEYISYKNSEEYRQSVACKIQNLMLEFQKASGYYEVFIPNMRKLSPSYDEYFKKLEKANERFLEHYPEASRWYSR
jgi:DNA-binding transcriptional MerR regulator